MKASIFCLPSVGSRAEIEAGMAATRPELYQRMLKELSELVKLADLRDRGQITPEEFAQAKKQLLGTSTYQSTPVG